MVTKAGEFIAALTERYDVIVIGGLAVIAHGFNRPTKDADVWLDPMESASAWAEVVERICGKFANLSIHTLPGWREISGPEISEAALRNPDAAVREMALSFLREFAAEGDPFSQAILDDRTIPPP